MTIYSILCSSIILCICIILFVRALSLSLFALALSLHVYTIRVHKLLNERRRQRSNKMIFTCESREREKILKQRVRCLLCW